MCKYMADSSVPVMCVCSNNTEAQRLYDAGCTYALQQVSLLRLNPRTDPKPWD
jgi:hypothetical protein